jgi:hypothetical protein
MHMGTDDAAAAEVRPESRARTSERSSLVYCQDASSLRLTPAPPQQQQQQQRAAAGAAGGACSSSRAQLPRRAPRAPPCVATMLSSLPDELLRRVFSHLAGWQAARCACVCRAWRAWVAADAGNWQRRLWHSFADARDVLRAGRDFNVRLPPGRGGPRSLFCVIHALFSHDFNVAWALRRGLVGFRPASRHGQRSLAARRVC